MVKEEFDKTLKNIGLDRKAFAELTNISYNTVNNWNDNKKPIPNWVESWLSNYKKSTILDNIINDLTPYLKE
ncbi:hypothetical protein [Arcobacter sp.]|uniref:hypothetical protein n=1 Tax=Arcobacter sp. TaxID=1872629 RepID=UPI003D13BFAE